MLITNKEEYKEIAVSSLKLSTRVYNCLIRSKLDTLYLVIENYDKLPKLRNMGAKSLSEIDDLLWNILGNGAFQPIESTSNDEDEEPEENATPQADLPPEILSRPATDLNVSVRVCNSFHNEGIETIEQVLALHPADVLHMRNMGKLSAQQLQEQIELLSEMGEDYFAITESAEEEEPDAPQYSKRELDIVTVKNLQDSYGFKSIWLCEWYNVSRQRIYQKLAKRINHGHWCGKQLRPAERAVITEMINAKSFYCERDGAKYYLVNNMEDDCAFLIVSANDIKCFFLKDLPDALQAGVRCEKLNRLTQDELSAIETLGHKVSIMKKPYFVPNDSATFKKLALERGLSNEEYAQFLTGVSYCPKTVTVTDERIIPFLEENTIDGKTMIPSTPDSQWIRNYISRVGYNTDEFIEFFGFSTKASEDTTDLDFTAEDFSVIEDDMRSYDTGTDYVGKIFAEYPLLGSKIISQKNLDVLYQKTRKYIDQLLNNSYVKPNLKAEMQITLAVINYAKDWDTEEESGFWRFITTSFGYRDESGQLRNLLCKCVKDALTRNHRWFITSTNGNQYKATIVAHALTTKRAWMYFCGFLFDFYKTNLDWEYIEDDPMIPRMVTALRNKVQDTDDISDESIEISSKVYHFREGIIKLIVQRPNYAVQFVSSLIRRIDGLINHTATPAVTYEEQLCDEWMAKKLQGLSATRRRETSAERRTVAIDYTRIKPVYQLHNETEVCIVFPDVRLAKNDFSSLKLSMCCDGHTVEQKALSYYGNELGKTMSGFTVRLEDYMRKSCSQCFNPQIIITCDDDEIYNSGRTLVRDCLVFHNKTETDISSCEKGGYSIFVPRNTAVDFTNADVGIIQENSYLNGYYVDLQKDFVINIDGKLGAFDNEQNNEGLRVIMPNSKNGINYIVSGMRYRVVSEKEAIHIVTSDNEHKNKYRLAVNSNIINLDSLPHEESSGTVRYKLELGELDADEVSLNLMDIANNRLLLRHKFKVIRNLEYHFNRPYYFSNEDFREAKITLIVGENVSEYPITPSDSKVCVPFHEGELEITVPLIKVIDNINEEWNGANLYWIKDIPQERFLSVKAPVGLTVEVQMNNQSMGTEGQNSFALGNAVYGVSNSDDISWLKISLEVSQNGHNSQSYLLGKIATKEQFVETPRLTIEGNSLSWDRGFGFIGDATGRLQITVGKGTQYEETYPLDLNEDIITDDIKLPIGEYEYTISKQSENLFSLKMTEIASGSLAVGDVNELRFLKHIIQIDTITLEENGNYNAVKIRPCYIDHIEYKGVQYCGSENRECPVYSGVMFYIGSTGKRREYSFSEYRDEKGHQRYQINPVRIVYINDTTLSITLDTGNPDVPGDGFYYFKYFDKFAMKSIYQITDREPTMFNKDKYYLADLYSYTRKGV